MAIYEIVDSGRDRDILRLNELDIEYRHSHFCLNSRLCQQYVEEHNVIFYLYIDF